MSIITTTEEPTEDEEDVPVRSDDQTERCFNDEEYKQYIIHDSHAEDVYIGVVDGYGVIYPKYDNVSEEFMKHLWVYSEIDGVVLENNWPLDESDKAVNETHYYLPYFNKVSDLSTAMKTSRKLIKLILYNQLD